MAIQRFCIAILTLFLGLLVGLVINLASAKVLKSDYVVMVKWNDIPRHAEWHNITYQVKITKVSLADRVVWIKFVNPSDEK